MWTGPKIKSQKAARKWAFCSSFETTHDWKFPGIPITFFCMRLCFRASANMQVGCTVIKLISVLFDKNVNFIRMFLVYLRYGRFFFLFRFTGHSKLFGRAGFCLRAVTFELPKVDFLSFHSWSCNPHLKNQSHKSYPFFTTNLFVNFQFKVLCKEAVYFQTPPPCVI